MVQSMTFLGVSTGIAKSTGKPFYLVYLYGESDFADGLKAYSLFVEKPDYEEYKKTFKPLQVVQADVRRFGGKDCLISMK